MDGESYPLSSMRSFSPKINKDLVSLKSFLPQNVLKCKDLLETNIGDRFYILLKKLKINY